MSRPAHNPYYWVIGALLVALLPQLLAMPPQMVPIVLLPVIWRLLAEIRGWKPFHTVIRILFTVVVVFVLVANYGTLLGRRAAVGLLAVMLALKLLETFRVRDARIVASLSLFLCATQFLFTQKIYMLVYAVACLVTVLTALVFLARKEAFAPTGEPPPLGTGLVGQLRFSLRMLIIALPMGLALFMFFPRWGSPLWGVPEEALDAKSGLSDSMSPGSIQGLFMDDSPAFRVDFGPRVPSRREMYWRGPVFWEFDGRTWQDDFYGRNVPARRKPSPVGSIYYTVQLEPTEQHWLFALDYPALVPDGARLSMDYQLYSLKPITSLRSYEMISNPDFTDTPELSNIIRTRALQLPGGLNPRTRELAAQWRRETPSDAELVIRALRHFNRDDFRYTLNPPLLTRNTVDEFLFDTRAGFCEHYASAFTVLMRMAGIPARVVTGYQGGWFNDFAGYVLIRQSDAHAWSEVWLPGQGWIRVDPTAAVAPSRVEQNALEALDGRRHLLDFEWVRNLRNGMDVIGRTWNDWVIAFDSVTQSTMFSLFGIEQLGTAGLVLSLVVSMVAIGILLAPLMVRLRAMGQQDRAWRLWQKFIQRLRKAGVEISHAMGPLELAAFAGERLARQRKQIHRISDLYLRIRYARLKPPIAELDRAVRAFRARP